MSFLDSVVNQIQEKKIKMDALYNGRILHDATVSQSNSGDSVYRTEEAENLYKKLTWVYKCVAKNAENIAQVPKKIYQIKDNDPNKKIDISNRPEFEVIYKPNPFQTNYDFWYESILRLLLQGELFWLKAKTSQNKIIQLYADWRSEDVTVVPDPQYMIKKFIHVENNKKVPYSADEIFFLKFIDPQDQLRGLPPLKAGTDAAILEIDAINYNKKQFSEGFTIKGVVDAPVLKNEEDARRVQERFKKLYSGRKGENVAVTYGGAKFTALNSASNRDAQFIEQRNMNREEILAVFGVPPAIVGIFDSAIKANAIEQRKTFWIETLIPLMTKVITTINQFLLPELLTIPGSIIVMEPDLSNIQVLKEDTNDKSKRYNEAFSKGAATPNDIRVNILNLEPIDTPEMNTTYMPFNLVPTSMIEDNQSNNDDEKNLPASIENKRFQTRLSVEKRDNIWSKIIKIQEPYEELFKKLIVKLFKQQRKETLKILKDNFEKSITKGSLEIEGLVIPDDWVDIFAKESAALFKKSLFGGVAVVNALTDEDLIPLLSPIVEQEAGALITKFSTDINETTRTSIIENIREGLKNDESLEEISLRINTIFNYAEKNRSKLIARTESMNALNKGQLLAGKNAAEFPNKMWLTSRDGKVRESHQIDGEVVGMNETFSNGFEYPNDYNERCTMIVTNEEKTI